MKEKNNTSVFKYLFKIFQGVFVGVGALVPGISGGVLCLIFGIYKTIMEFLADPIKKFKTHFPKLFPYGIGLVIGVVLSAKVLAFLFEKFENPSICVFVGLIIGMLPSLFKEAGKEGRSKNSYIAMIIFMVVIFSLLGINELVSFEVPLNFGSFLFCGFCLALSIIAPGMSFSILMVPLGLYQPFNDAIDKMQIDILIPCAIGAIITFIVLSRPMNKLFEKHYSIAFHAIFGIVIGATIMTIPYKSFVSLSSSIINLVCIIAGIVAALIIEKFNQKFADAK